MLTSQGWRLLMAAALLAASGYLFGIVVLVVVAIAGLGVVVSGIAYVWLCPSLTLIHKSLRARRVHVGDQNQIHILLRNPRRLRSPVLALTETIQITQQRTKQNTATTWGPTEFANLMVPPVKPHQEIAVSLNLPTQQRGKALIGPLHLTLHDPLSVAVRKFQLGQQLEALIYPTLAPVQPPKNKPTNMLDAGKRNPIPQHADELHGLRPFQTGDDPRRIHWRSSAHQDALIVRQMEDYSHTYTTVLLDTTSGALGNPATYELFEAMVSMAAGLCCAAQQRGDYCRFATSANFNTGYGSDTAHLYRIYEHLALVQPTPTTSHQTSDLHKTVERLGMENKGGVLVIVAAKTDDIQQELSKTSSLKFRSNSLVVLDPVGVKDG